MSGRTVLVTSSTAGTAASGAGTKLPNLTYMLGFESEEALKAAWAKFGQHPDWLKLRNDPLYRDTVSTITNLLLRPTGGSQI